MNTKILAIAVAVTAATTITSVAEAGGGVRLPFGYPMGSFVATPSKGGSYAASPSAAQKRLARKKAASELAARRAAASAKVAKQESNVETEKSAEPKATGSTALIETEKAPAEATTEAKAEETAAATETATAAAPAEETKAEESKTEEPSQVSELSCKKYIPAIGLTVSVGCEK